MTTLSSLRVTVNGAALPMSKTALSGVEPVVLGDSIEVRWSRASALDHAGPTTLTFRMVRPATSLMPPPAKGAKVTVTCRETGRDPAYDRDGNEIGYSSVDKTHLVFTGEIDGSVEHAPGDRWQFITVTATDAIGVAARTYISAPPWPWEERSVRLARLRALAPALFDTAARFENLIGNSVAPIDIDNRTLWDVLTSQVDVSSGVLAPSTSGLISITDLYYSMGGWTGITSEPVFGTWLRAVPNRIVGAFCQEVPAAACEELDRADSWDSGVSTVTVEQSYCGTRPSDDGKTWVRDFYTTRSVVYGQRTRPGRAMRITSDISSDTGVRSSEEMDRLDVSSAVNGAAKRLAECVVASAGKGVRAVDSLTIRLARARPGWSTWLLATGPDRFTAMLAVTNGPLGVSRSHTVTGCTLRLSTDLDKCVAVVELDPVQLAGIDPVPISDFVARPDLTPTALAPTGNRQIPTFTTIGMTRKIID